MTRSKVTDLQTAAALISDGAVLGIHGASTHGSPMALLRELIRVGRLDLHVVTLGGSIGIDWLAAVGAISRATFCVITMEQFGLCSSFRRGVEDGAIAVEELSETGFYARIGAAARGLPFLPTRGMVGSDLLEVGNPNVVLMDDPFGGVPVVACRSLPLDVALVHAHRADEQGNVAIDPTVRYPTMTLLPRAADRVIVTVEEMVPSSVLRQAPERTIIPGFLVDAVVVVPFGAHPTSLHPRYSYDADLHTAWKAATSSELIDAFLDRYVYGPDTHEHYMELVGLGPPPGSGALR